MSLELLKGNLWILMNLSSERDNLFEYLLFHTSIRYDYYNDKFSIDIKNSHCES